MASQLRALVRSFEVCRMLADNSAYQSDRRPHVRVSDVIAYAR